MTIFHYSFLKNLSFLAYSFLDTAYFYIVDLFIEYFPH